MTKTTTQKIKGHPKNPKGLRKTPSVVKDTIPQKKTRSALPENARVRRAKLTKNDIKIMLANEVVRAQFPQKRTWTGNTSKMDVPKKTNTRTTNRRRVNKTDNVQHAKDCEVDCSKTAIDTKKGSKMLKRQENEIVGINTTCTTSKDESVQVKEETSIPNRLRSRRTANKSAQAKDNHKKQLQPQKKQTKSRAARRKLQMKHKPEETCENKLDDNISEPALKEKIDVIDMDKSSSKSSLILRSNSRSSELSWTKNISSSATTSCITVSPNDFFAIDNKVPLVRLISIDWAVKDPVNINQVNQGKSISDTDSDSATSGMNKGGLQGSDDDTNIDISLPSLNLSTSSSDTCSTNNSENTSEPVDKFGETLKKISSNLESLELEMVSWTDTADEDASHDSDLLNNEKIQSIFLTDEGDVLVTCREIKRVLLEPKEVTTNENLADTETAEGNDCEEKSDEVIETGEDINTKETNVLPCCTLAENDNANLSPADSDDEDTISLFAESITDLDTPKSNDSGAGDDLNVTEEYIPEPISKCPFKTPEVRYQPTVISNTTAAKPNLISNLNSPIQNTVSTSFCKDRKITYGNRAYGNQNRILNKEATCSGNVMSQPILISSIYKPIQGVKSVVFRGVCFFHLISSCKNNYCKFPHIFIEIDDIRKKLSVLSEDLFLEEYILVKSWPHLRRRYGQCFVDECINRDLSRMLVEMSIDFVIKANCSSTDDERLKTEVAEKVLLYLNDIELARFTDLLTYKVEYSGVLLYEFFLSTISKSQNFSRFKAVFIKLADFMSHLQRVFDQDAATLLLERISILPYDEGLALGMIKVIKKTDEIIFSSPLMRYFETQLRFSNLNLYNELIRLKNNALANSEKFERTNNKAHTEVSGQTQINSIKLNKIIGSPIATKILNNASQPMLMRTVDLNQLGLYLRLQAAKANMSVFDNISQRRFDQSVTTPRWLGSKYRLEQFPKAGPSKCQRTPASKYFQDYY
ncbi:hypothetical protein KGM_201790 [Danaus plexippus plexippus]|uniref:Uncharacterized protein n=1 Tax=Danaus plexippus plexippus TaxID=278856 RepID=A0A212FJ24_DANPL|nr:hypothetical protein KGM_201790 [Danaus plexippus plexippus]